MAYGDGVERPFLDRQNHKPWCDVWNGFDYRFLCSCRAVELPKARVIPEFPNYTIHVDGTIMNISTGKAVRVENDARMARLVDEEGNTKSRRINVLIDTVYRDLA